MPSLSLIKAHLNLAPDDDRDNELLLHYADAATTWVGAYIGPSHVIGPLERQAILLMVAHSYESREAVSFSNPFTVPFGVHELLSPNKARITGHIPAAPSEWDEPEIVADPVVTP